MEEEEKVVEEQPVEEQPVEEQPVSEKEQKMQEAAAKDPNKFSLTTFILAIVGFIVAWYPVGGVAAIIMGAMCMKRVKVSNPDRKPYTVFDKISKPVGLVDLIVGILSVVGWFIGLSIWIIGLIIAAAAANA